MAYSLIPKSKDAQRLEPIHGSFSIILGQKDGKIVTLEEMLEESERTGKPIIIDASQIKGISIFKGKKPLLTEGKKIHHIEIRAIPLELQVTILVPGSSIQYDIILRAEEKNPTTLVLTNYLSQFPIKFKFQFDLEKGNKLKNAGRFNITCELENMNVVQAYQFYKFMSDAIDNKIITMKDSKSGKTIFTAYINDIDNKTKPFGNQFDLLGKLSFIQEMTGIKISLPLSMVAEDVISIENAYNFYKNRKLILSSKGYDFTLEFDKKTAGEMLGKFSDDGLLEKFSIRQKDRLIQVCGVELHFGPIVACCPTMRTDKPIQELKKELDNSNEETFKIRLLPINEDPVIVTPSAWPQVFPE